MGIRTFDIAPSAPRKQPVDSDQPNFLVLVFDTFSAEHLSFFGYPRKTTPNLTRIAEHATVYHHHYSGGNFTMPGTASLLTGTAPWSHRAIQSFGSVLKYYYDHNIFSALNQDYFITAFTHNYFVMGLLNQFQQHLDQIIPPNELAVLSESFADLHLDDDFTASLWSERIIRSSGTDIPGSLFLSFLIKDFNAFTPDELKKKYAALFPRGVPNNTLGLFFFLENAIDWIRKQIPGMQQPYLAYYHLFPPHEPYMTRKEFVDIFQDGWSPQPKPVLAFPQNRSVQYLDQYRRYYDEYIAFVDEEIGRLVQSLEKDDALKNTYLIITSDHGQLFEREIHGHLTPTLYDPIVHIPLLIVKPGQQVREDIYSPTTAIDVLPTLLHLAGKPVPDWCEGQILPPFNPDTSNTSRPIYIVEAKDNARTGPLKTATVALIKDHKKIIHYFGYEQKQDDYEFYNLKNDPDELEDRFPGKKGIFTDMEEELLVRLDEVNQRGA